MILKKQNRILYGIPYQGSKTKIIQQIAMCFPPADNFYDLFGGGFSVSHYMLLRRSKSFKTFHYNEIRPGMCELIQDAIKGKYNYKVFKPEWISRDKFFAEKDSNPYVKIIWSFGNNGKSYLFGKDIEQIKRSMHQAIVFNDFDELFINLFKIDKWPDNLSITGKRLYIIFIIRKLKRVDIEQLERLEQLQQLERLEQLQRLEQLEQLERLRFTNLSYQDVKIENNSVIYCDIPYESTGDYGITFNHKQFFDWAHEQKNPVFISEYNIDDKRFNLLKEIDHRSTFAQKKINLVKEKLYCNKIAMDIINKHMDHKK